MAFPARADTPAAPELAGFWRSFFARPAGPPLSPPDNPATPEKAALGKRLFFDTLLSGDGTRACASCHDPARAFTDGRAHALARDGSDLPRGAPPLLDLGWAKSFMWDGRAETLEAQVAMPIEHPQELAGSWNEIVARIKREPELDVAIHVAFRDRPAVQPGTIVKALAAYLRTLASPETRFDRWVAGDDAAMSGEEMAGFALFVGKAGCVGCHGTWRFTDDRFHDIGLKSSDPGRGAVAGGVPGLAAFKTPTLRELTLTAPYMHDGSLATLEAVVEHYAGNHEHRPSLSTNMVSDLKLEPGERVSLVSFLRTLSSTSLQKDAR
jgi:cytochrome c peroxidase